MDATPFDQMGIDDKTLLRLLKLGVADFASMDISKMAGDDPQFGVVTWQAWPSICPTARKACAAWRSVLERQAAEELGTPSCWRLAAIHRRCSGARPRSAGSTT